MTGLLISREMTGVATARSVDPFDTLVVYRIDREHWKQTPDVAGVYLLYGTSASGELTVYVGMSRTSMRSRIGNHHVTAKKNSVRDAVSRSRCRMTPAVAQARLA